MGILSNTFYISLGNISNILSLDNFLLHPYSFLLFSLKCVCVGVYTYSRRRDSYADLVHEVVHGMEWCSVIDIATSLALLPYACIAAKLGENLIKEVQFISLGIVVGEVKSCERNVNGNDSMYIYMCPLARISVPHIQACQKVLDKA